ncbi:MAG: response regulator transcription factor [Bacteroidales bacterium]|nr:response regulator transcription factor [Bacteroidales bacterium]
MTQFNCLILEPSFLIRKGLVSFFRSFQPIGLIFDTDQFESSREFSKQNVIDILVCTDDFFDRFQNQHFALTYIIKHDKKSEGSLYLNILHPKEVLINQVMNDLNRIKKHSKQEEDALSEREIAVLKLVAQGQTNKEIADTLFISVHTVMTHRKNITQKLGIKTVSGLTMYAIIHNLIEPIDLK